MQGLWVGRCWGPGPAWGRGFHGCCERGASHEAAPGGSFRQSPGCRGRATLRVHSGAGPPLPSASARALICTPASCARVRFHPDLGLRTNAVTPARCRPSL